VLGVFTSAKGVNSITRAVYLDHQATTHLAPGVLEEMLPCFSRSYGNPHSSEHAFGWRSSDAIERARGQVAEATGFDPDEVIFTSGATEANNLAILGFDRDDRPRLAHSAVEHKSVIAPMRERARLGCRTTFVPVDAAGRVDLTVLRAALRDGVDLVSIMAVNNEIGTAQPLEVIATLCREAGAFLHVDAAQALAFRNGIALAPDADIVSVSSHKIGGPAGIGALLVRRHARRHLSPVLFGGGQEDGLRPGTLPLQLCVGFGAACTALADLSEITAWRARSETFASSLVAEVPGLTRNGGGVDAHPGNVSVTLPKGEADAVIARLQPHLALSTGSACTSGILEPSHVLMAIGLDSAEAERTIRFSVGRYTDAEELAEAVRKFGEAIRSSG
jgi:cysteine desulfurase